MPHRKNERKSEGDEANDMNMNETKQSTRQYNLDA